LILKTSCMKLLLGCENHNELRNKLVNEIEP